MSDLLTAPVQPTLFDALGTLAAGGRLTPTSLDLSTADGTPIEFDRYEEMGRYLGAVNRSCSWWVGDWLIYGEETYADRFAQATTATGLAEQTLLNRMYVCRHVPPTRRRASLPFSVHAEVAALPAKEQVRWLDKAEKAGWTQKDLRNAIREAKRGKSETASAPPEGQPFSAAAVLEAARRVVGSAREYGADYLVPKEEMAILTAAIGMEE